MNMHKYNIHLVLTWLFYLQTCQEFIVTLMAPVEQCRIQDMFFSWQVSETFVYSVGFKPFGTKIILFVRTKTKTKFCWLNLN